MSDLRAGRLAHAIGRFDTRRRGPHRRHWFVRDEDLLVLDVAVENLKVVPGEGSAPAQLERAGPGTAYLILTFPPQHLTEEAYFTTVAEYPLTPPPPPPGEVETQPLDDDADDDDDSLGEMPIRAYVADWSTLSFIVRDEDLPIDWTFDGILLAIPGLELSVAPNALPNRDPPWFNSFLEGLLQPVELAPIFASGGSGGSGGTGGTPGRPGFRRVSALGMARERSRIRTIGHALGISDASGSQTIGLWKQGVTTKVDLADILLRPAPRPPTTRETAIELPHRLVLSPNRHGAWFHSESAVHSDVSGHTELWHTRLGVRQPNGTLIDGPDPLRTVRAIWTKDAPVPKPPPLPSNDDPFRASLDSADRYNLVHLSSNFQLRRPGNEDEYFEPQAADVDLLALSALGGWLDSRGVWDEQPLGLEVEEWRHRATLGRDHYVRVVYAGRLFPLGHRASLVKVTERRFETSKTGHPAYQRQMMFLVIREPLRTYGSSGLTYTGSETKRVGEKWDLKFPFTAARILNRVSPLLDKPEDTEVRAGYNRRAFWPYVKKQPFCFHVLATDMTGQPVDLAMPLVFVGQTEGDKGYAASLVPTRVGQTSVAQEYDTRTWPGSTQLLATVALGGQKVAFAASADPDDTTFAVESLTFAGEVPVGSAFNEIPARLKPRYVPVVREAKLHVPAIQRIAQTDQPAALVYDATYLKDGFGGANVGEVFLAAKDKGQALGIPFSSRADRSGGLVAPDMRLGGLSRITGPVGGDIASAVQGTFTPSDWFAGALTDARLFGTLKLTDIIGTSPFSALDQLPRFVGDSLNQVQRIVADLERLQRLLAAESVPTAGTVTTLLEGVTAPETGQFAGLLDGTITPAQFNGTLGTLGDALDALRLTLGASGIGAGPRAVLDEAIGSLLDTMGAVDLGLLERIAKGDLLPESFAARFDWRPVVTSTSVFKPHGTRNLILSVEAAGDDLIVTCSLDAFDLDLEVLVLKFNRVQFRVRAGKKPEIDVDFAEFEFAGPLRFIETLRGLVPLDGLSDPPDVDVTPEGITAGFSTALPNVAVGVFSLENLSLAAGFSVPFVGPPMSTGFRFCERENPARLTGSMFGGGFFVGITVDASGLQVVEGAIEFGAAVSVNFGVASGSVSAMAGLYFKIEGSKVTLAGYFRLRGEVEALGIVSVCIELYLEMRYEDGGGTSNKCVGTATISVEIEVALWSTTIKITCTKKFAGSGGDPTLAETLNITPSVTSTDWNEYCGAFAA